MSENEIGLKSISELLGMNFFIPSYQRGYRWEERQIIDLLNDIFEFQKQKGKSVGEFYCLQPLIVTKRKNNTWEVIDGQQRLTTIYILLSYLKDAIKLLKLANTRFFIEYETREKEECSSKLFLENITNISDVDKTNIDFYRMSDAYLTIKNWFDENESNINVGDFCNVLLKTDYGEQEIDGEIKKFDNANNIRFIWYPINANSGTEETPNITFIKYNQGKIDLTNAELIKAIFYLPEKSDDEKSDKKKYQIKIGYEWDEMENTLRKPDFWHFINPVRSYVNHIEFIFELVAAKYEKITCLKIHETDRYYSFYIFNELISKNIQIYEDSKFDNTREFLWDEIKTYYHTFIEWYNDNQHFHLIGFLLQTGENIENIKQLAESNSKSGFIKELKNKIKGHFGEIDFNEIGYEDTKKSEKILLLFNVITTMNSGYNRFAFDRYASENWSLEHIHAQQSEEEKDERYKRLLLLEQKEDNFICRQDDFLTKINELLAMEKIDQKRFKNLQREIFNCYSDTENIIDSIKNLALLTPPDNSSLNNKSFHKKRDKIKELDEKGSFIPICTKNVFLKYYSKNVEQNVKWDKKDMEEYLGEMKSTLKEYINIKEDKLHGE